MSYSFHLEGTHPLPIWAVIIAVRFSCSLQANAGIVPSYRPLPPPSKSLSVNSWSYSHVFQRCIISGVETASLWELEFRIVDWNICKPKASLDVGLDRCRTTQKSRTLGWVHPSVKIFECSAVLRALLHRCRGRLSTNSLHGAVSFLRS
jgi:hypothetical protein